MDIIQSMWIGPKLGTMERLCIKSFLSNGHEFHLYTYGAVEGVPEGAKVMDATQVLPEDLIPKFRFLAQFSDFFRYSVVFQKGGWWVDMDLICLKPFIFEQDTVVSGDLLEVGKVLHNSPFKAPVGSSWLGKALEYIEHNKGHWGCMGWSEIGGGLLSAAAIDTSLPNHYIVSQYLFDPFQCSAGYLRYINAEAPLYPSNTYSLHLHHAMFTLPGFGRQVYDLDAKYPNTCIYETLKRRYL